MRYVVYISEILQSRRIMCYEDTVPNLSLFRHSDQTFHSRPRFCHDLIVISPSQLLEFRHIFSKLRISLVALCYTRDICFGECILQVARHRIRVMAISFHAIKVQPQCEGRLCFYGVYILISVYVHYRVTRKQLPKHAIKLDSLCRRKYTFG